MLFLRIEKILILKGRYYSMNALDNLLANALSTMIEAKLGKITVNKIEKRLKERYNIEIIDAIRDFQKMDATLREFFGPGADEIEKDFLTDFISLDKTKKENSWLTIENQKLASFILESFGDPDKKRILEASLSQPNVILGILENCNMPKSSGYRVIKELIDDGLLTEEGFSTTRDGKKVNKYTSIFENIKIDIQGPEQKIIVKVQINEKFIRESFLIKLMGG